MKDKTDQATTDPIDSRKINDTLWKACDTFRGTVDPSIYKDYILTMLFLKYISDVWQDHYETYKREHGDHPELIKELADWGAALDRDGKELALAREGGHSANHREQPPAYLARH